MRIRELKTMLIEGLKIQVSATELVTLADLRATHHEERAAFYREQVENLRSGGVTAERSMTNDPISGLETDRKQHEAKARYFAFLRDHVIVDAIYLLDVNDLARLEIVDRYM